MARNKAHLGPHRYRRSIGRLTKHNKESGFKDVFKCTLPNCTHYAKDFLILGKESICNKCGQVFILPMATRALTNVPHCKKCTKKRYKPTQSIDEIFNSKEEELEV
jgi:hypothetical protein